MTARPVPTSRGTVGIGKPHPRLDSEEKVRGATRYAADVPIPGLLHARIVPSLYAHARILSIDASAALAIRGVAAVLTAADLPIIGRGDMRMFEPLARDEAVFAGQPVALVVAHTEAAAEDAAEQVIVHSEQLPTVTDVEAAMLPDSPLARISRLVPEEDEDAGAAKAAHAAIGGTGAALAPEDLSPNVVSRKRYIVGDPTAGFEKADVVIEGRFRTSWVYQAYLEPHAATAWIEPDGTLAVLSSTQGTFYARKQLASIYGLPLARVRVTGAPLGGAFGSKVLVVDPLVAGAALRLRRPVRLALTRREDFAATNPAPGSIIEVRIGARRSGRFTALDAHLVFDAGAYPEWSTEGIAAVLVGGVYRWPAAEVRAYGVRTNRFGTGSYRGPGGPQAVFVIESLIDELAEHVGLDPMELRHANLVGPGDAMIDGEPWPRIGAQECLAAVGTQPLWHDRGALPSGEGVGVAIGVWPGGKEPAAAICRLNGDGTLTVITGVVDMSGTATGFALIAAETFGLSPSAVDVVSLDSAGAPQSPMSAGSVITYAAGRAVREAAAEARRQLLDYAAQEFEIDPGDLEVVDGVVRPVGSSSRGRAVVEFAKKLHDFGSVFPPVEGHASTAHRSLAPSCAAHLAHVRVDMETGEVQLLRLVVAQDVGRALNPALIEGQMRGGAAQGVGWALSEELVHSETGQLLTGSFLDYGIPTASDVPLIETLIVEVPAPDGPFGAKGIGEASVLPAGAAVANAIAAATGLRLRELPMSAPRVWDAARAKDRIQRPLP